MYFYACIVSTVSKAIMLLYLMQQGQEALNRALTRGQSAL